MVVSELDEVQYDLEIDGEQVREQLARHAWERAGWATIAVTFREKDRGGAWKPTKLAVLRFRRVHDAWKREAAITLSGDEALTVIDAVGEWRAMLEKVSP
jgi:hypothetical protein